jgi:hypothetical protein
MVRAVVGVSRFYDCIPSGTITSQLAQDACVSYVGAGNASACQLDDNPGDGGAMNAWCSGPSSSTFD